MAEKEFNLLREPWIRVMEKNGHVIEVSMLDLFRNAPEYLRLAGELPTQDVAILRLLLAVLHSVFERFDLNSSFAPFTHPADALHRWKALWDHGCFPMDIIEKYLSKYEERFYLFHTEYPFYQVPELKKAGEYSTEKLNGVLSQSENKIRLFPMRTGVSKSALSYSEAARWLINVNSFDDVSGSGKGRGENKRKQYELGWLAKLGLIIAEGDNMFQTLLLNLVLLKNGEDELWGEIKPIWEQEVRDEESCNISVPESLTELYTLQSRRIILHRQDNMVTGFSLMGGDMFPEENALIEPMTVWVNKAKKANDSPIYYPKPHNPSRQLWRDFAVLVSQNQSNNRPGIVSWLMRLSGDGYLPHYQYKFLTVGIKFDSKKMSVTDVFSDSITFNADLLSGLGQDWVQRIIDEVSITEALVEQLGRFAQKLVQSISNTDGLKQKNAAREQAYFQLDMPFRQWLRRINPELDSMNQVCTQWWELSQKIVRDLGNELVNQAGPQAFVGRVMVDEKTNKKYRYCAAEAYNYFLYKTSSKEALLKEEGKNGKK